MSRFFALAAVEEEAACPPDALVCVPENVLELFEFPALFHIGPMEVSRTIVLIFLAAFIVMAAFFISFRKARVVPTKFQALVETIVSFIRDEVAVGIIGPEGGRYAPYLMTLFTFILVGNLFEVTPFINFPITSRMALPMFMALLTYVIFIVAGIAKQGPMYFWNAVAPPGVPKALLFTLVIPIELVSTFFIRPFSLAVRLFANMVAGHIMLSVLLVTAVVYMLERDAVWKVASVFPLALGIAIFVFEIIVSILQAYIFTLLSAVYIQTSVHPEH